VRRVVADDRQAERIGGEGGIDSRDESEALGDRAVLRDGKLASKRDGLGDPIRIEEGRALDHFGGCVPLALRARSCRVKSHDPSIAI
jgi:hypothetical protein